MRLLNCYAIQAPPEGRSPISVQGMAGIRAFAAITPSPQRAAIQFGGTLYSVAGGTFYSVSSAGVETSIGSVTASGSVDIAKNTGQITILVEPDLWVYESGVLTQITDTDFTSRGAKKMAVLDNFGGFIEPNSGRFFICDLADFTVYDPLDFATAESAPDDLVSIEANSSQFVLFGEDTTELWDNVGGSGFPFVKVTGGVIECGCAGKDATTVADNTVWWLDPDRIFRKLEGITPRRISNDGTEQQWQDYASVDDAFVYSYIYDGHTFIVVRFPTAGATWGYDINTGEWHERQSYGYDHWRAAWVVKCYGKALVGDTQTGNIGEIHATTYSEWGDILSREATTGVIRDGGRRLFHDRLELDVEVGQGLESGQGSDPVMMMDQSDDGGINFTAKPNFSLGTTGQTRKRVHRNALGSSYQRVYRFRQTDPVPFGIHAGQLDVR